MLQIYFGIMYAAALRAVPFLLWKHPVYRRIAVIGMTRNAAIQYASAGVCCIAVPIFSPENAAAFDTTNPL